MSRSVFSTGYWFRNLLLAIAVWLPIYTEYQSGRCVAQTSTGENHLTSSVGTSPANNVNAIIGATRFYNAGFTGQGTITANVEAGHIWNGHESLGHVQQFSHDASAFGSTTNDLFDRHATWVGSHIGGRVTAVNPNNRQMGIAPGTDLRSGAIATSWAGNAYAASFNISSNSFNGGYLPFFGTADVINSSWGGTDPSGSNGFAVALDALAAANPNTTFVVSAGNSGSGANTVGFPGSGYNAITVGALSNGGNNSYNTVAGFSSRGPQDFDNGNSVITGVRAAVDLVAPGDNLQAAFYGGQTGGNNTTLTNSSLTPGSTLYSSVAGTSFASPIVAGSVALLKSASYNTPELSINAASRDTLVVKSILMNSADKIPGWSNGQAAHSNGLGGVSTTQSLDWVSGAGKINLDKAFDQYLTAGTRDVLGLANGNLGTVANVGWDLGNVLLNGTNTYSIGGLLQANSLFQVTLNWFRNRDYNPALLSVGDIGQANLSLRVIDLLTNSIISESISLYNVSEHLSFLLPRTSQYGIQVSYDGNTFGTMGDVNYGIAWSSVSAVPEPGSMVMVTVIISCVGLYRRRRFKR